MAPSDYSVEYQQAHIHENRAPELLNVHVSLMVLATLAVVLRFISRRMKAGIHADDWIILLALIITMGECTGVLLASLRFGSAKHAITLKHPDTVAKITIAVQCLYTAGISTAKISTLILYHRIFVNQRFRIAVWAVGVFIATYSFVQFIVVIFQCNPVRGAWDFTVKATCIELMLELQIMGIFNAITDIITVCLPMVMLWRLQMPPKKKAQVFATFLLGGFVCIVSIYRVPKQAQISLVDASYTDVSPCNWSFVEVSVAITCACFPTYRPLLRRCVETVTGSSRKSTEEIDSYGSPVGKPQVWEKKKSSDDSDVSTSSDSLHKEAQGSVRSPADSSV